MLLPRCVLVVSEVLKYVNVCIDACKNICSKDLFSTLFFKERVKDEMRYKRMQILETFYGFILKYHARSVIIALYFGWVHRKHIFLYDISPNPLSTSLRRILCSMLHCTFCVISVGRGNCSSFYKKHFKEYSWMNGPKVA